MVDIFIMSSYQVKVFSFKTERVEKQKVTKVFNAASNEEICLHEFLVINDSINRCYYDLELIFSKYLN